MEYKYKLSIIVPCYNSSRTIERLLYSVMNNGLNKNEYQLIIVDDNSTDNFLDIVKTFEDKINIVYAKTTREVHCPGNTRQAGIPFIEGEWFTFIDHDDMFIPNTFPEVFKMIEENNVQYVFSTMIEQILHNGTIRRGLGKQNDGWLHGKFFNTEKIIHELNVHFKDDMMGQEDLYFNSCAKAKLFSIGEDYFYNEEYYTYQWIETLDSLSHVAPYHHGMTYTDAYMRDYIISNTEPFFELYKENKDCPKIEEAISIILTTFLYCYFYYEQSIYFAGHTAFKNILHIYDFKEKIKEDLNFSEEDILQYIYARPEMYNELRQSSFLADGCYVEIQSFRDFVMNL